jgi:NADPH:quinone reductase-like Zn-dependent oxidoreductase
MGMAALSWARASLAQTPRPMTDSRMKAIVHYDYGSPDVLRLEETEKPVCSEDQALVRVRAVSLNPVDWHYMRGTPYLLRAGERAPFKPDDVRLGVDLAGDVEAVGNSIKQLKPGDAVFGTRFGSLAEYVCASEKSLIVKPVEITFEEAAAIPVAGMTALQGLRDEGKLQRGQKVLINGASGGVGTFAVQIAKSFGADVTGVCSTRNISMVQSIGADHVVDYTREDFTESGRQYDLILDMVGTHSLSDYRRALTPNGTLVVVGSLDKGRWLGPLAGAIRAVIYSKVVSQQFLFFISHTNREDLAILADLMKTGKMRSIIDRRYGLRQVPEAMRYLEEGHARGKVIVTLSGDDVAAAGVSEPLVPSMASAVGPVLVVLAAFGVMIGVPIVLAIALHGYFQRRHPGKKPYRWGYYFSLQSFLVGVAIGIMSDSGAIAAIAVGVVYGALAWFFAHRKHWAWVTLTLFSFNPAVWIINFIYLRKRWAEDSPGRLKSVFTAPRARASANRR